MAEEHSWAPHNEGYFEAGASSAPKSTESADITQLFRIDGIVHRAMDRLCGRIEVLFTRRHPNDSGESEWESRIRELEGQIDDIARDHGTPIHIVNHPKPAKPDTWQNKLIISLAIVAIAGAVTTYATVASLKTRIEDYILSNDHRMDQDEQRIRDSERRLDRGAT